MSYRAALASSTVVRRAAYTIQAMAPVCSEGLPPQPLATILLKHHSSDDTLNAYGVLGGNMFIPCF